MQYEQLKQRAQAASEVAYPAMLDPTPGKTESPLETELGRMSRAINALETITAKLEERLTPVMALVPPRVVNDTKNATSGSSPLAGALVSMTLQLESVRDRLVEIRSRVEL